MFGIFEKNNKNELKYDKKLIKKFHKDHYNLIEIIKTTDKAIKTNDTKKSKKYLKKLRMEILGHFMEEDIKLYWYLKRYYKNRENTLETVNMFENSIKDIQRDVLRFLGHYSKEGVKLDSTFREKFSKMVDELGSRIKTEENNLYTLYVK